MLYPGSSSLPDGERLPRMFGERRAREALTGAAPSGGTQASALRPARMAGRSSLPLFGWMDNGVSHNPPHPQPPPRPGICESGLSR